MAELIKGVGRGEQSAGGRRQDESGKSCQAIKGIKDCGKRSQYLSKS
jgi:hypothetical protein